MKFTWELHELRCICRAKIASSLVGLPLVVKLWYNNQNNNRRNNTRTGVMMWEAR